MTSTLRIHKKKKPSIRVYAYNPSAEGVETGGSLRFSGQLVSKTSRVVKPKSNGKTLTEKIGMASKE